MKRLIGVSAVLFLAACGSEPSEQGDSDTLADTATDSADAATETDGEGDVSADGADEEDLSEPDASPEVEGDTGLDAEDTQEADVPPDVEADAEVDEPDAEVGDVEAELPDAETDSTCEDSDGDGVCDEVDACPAGDDTLDADGDSVADACDVCDAGDDGQDADADGTPDACDTCEGDDRADEDNDGIPDACDACEGDNRIDSDNDGIPNDCDVCAGFEDSSDADGDRIPDGCDVCAEGDDSVDADEDSVPDGCDACTSGDDLQDSDGDGVPNDCDACVGDDHLDSDDDGVPNACDICDGADGVDGDDDGVPDACDICSAGDDSADDDGDDVADACDICAEGDDQEDRDADGTPDGCDACPADAQNDSDNDGVCNSADACPGSDDAQDGDSDGIADACDVCPLDSANDSDADGACDSDDVCAGGDDDQDADRDGVPDFCDVCPVDAADDSDLDGVCDSEDVCSLGDDLANADGDDFADSCDICPLDVENDGDLDGVCESSDVCALGDDTLDRDFDGTPDACDLCPDDSLDDSDGDNVCDSSDQCPRGDDTVDADNDAIADACDECPTSAANDANGNGTCDVDEILACADQIVPAYRWPAVESPAELGGRVEFGQTHVVQSHETRVAPRPTEHRENQILFFPDAALDDETIVLVAAVRDGVVLGVNKMVPPALLPRPLEQEITSVPLEPYSTEAWSSVLPWTWMEENTRIAVGLEDGGLWRELSTDLVDLGEPSDFTITRTKIVLFGDESFDTSTTSAQKLARDFFPSLPFASLKVVDSIPWVLDEFVIRTATGPQRVHSEAERLAVTNDPDHWSILKHQVALRLSLANTGRGFALTNEADGDSSPYAFGTSVGMGWFVDVSGNYNDIDDAPYAAGWTGWTAMWADECGNGFIHEVGHSQTFAHFVTGTAASWGIADEYPQDGTNLATHPWGWDTLRRKFRTWYRVDSTGPVLSSGVRVGKRDPMNGGESANGATCFPQYTAYHAWKTQQWAQNEPTIGAYDGAPGIFDFNLLTRQWVREAPDSRFQTPVAVDVPTATMIGTLGSNDEISQTYPPIFTPSGNVFAAPDPFTPGLNAIYNGAVYYVQIAYDDGSSEFALVARPTITNTSIYLYSFNIDLSKIPRVVRLFKAQSGYPNIVHSTSSLLHTRGIELPTQAFDPIIRAGRDFTSNGPIRLTQLCDLAYNCAERAEESFWRKTDGALWFSDADGVVSTTEYCQPQDSVTELEVPITDGTETRRLTVRAQRVVRNGEHEFAVAMNDATDWILSQDIEQGIRLTVPGRGNLDLPAGRWRTDGSYVINVQTGGGQLDQFEVDIDLEVIDRTAVNLGSTFAAPGLTTANSSMYFVVRDPLVGPTNGVWWDDGLSGAVPLRVPVIDTADGSLSYLMVDAQQRACSSTWDFHAGRSAGNCSHQALLSVRAAANTHLQTGHTYVTPDSSPLIIDGIRWHAPNAGAVIGSFALELTYTLP